MVLGVPNVGLTVPNAALTPSRKTTYPVPNAVETVVRDGVYRPARCPVFVAVRNGG